MSTQFPLPARRVSEADKSLLLSSTSLVSLCRCPTPHAIDSNFANRTAMCHKFIYFMT